MNLGSQLRKLNLSSHECVVVLGSTALFRRLRHHGWLRPLQESRPGRSCLYPVSRIEAVQLRLEGGEFPPPLPCEVRSQLERHGPMSLPSLPHGGQPHGRARQANPVPPASHQPPAPIHS